MTKLENNSTGFTLPRWISYTLCYIIWIALSVGAVWLMLRLRINLLDIALAADANPWALGAIDKFGLLLLGLLWIVGVFWVENYLRVGVERNALWQRIARVTSIEAALLLASYTVSWIVAGVA